MNEKARTSAISCLGFDYVEDRKNILPSSLIENIDYDDDAGEWKYKGLMSRRARWKMEFLLLRELRKHDKYKECRELIKIFFKSSRKSLNRGKVFVSTYRWIILLLSALMMEKMADGFAVGLTGEPFFRSLQLLIPLPYYMKNVAVGDVNHKYVIIGLQFLSTVLIATRYIICWIDPIWRSAGINENTDFSCENWQDSLSKTNPWDLVYTIIISAIEFVVLYHAAISIPHVDQWMHFILLLIIIDILCFLVPNLVKSLVYLTILISIVLAVVAFWLSFLALIVGTGVSLAIIIAIVAAVMLPFSKMRDSNWKRHLFKWVYGWIPEMLDRLGHNIFDYILRQAKKPLHALGEVWKDYSIWLAADLASVLIGLWFFGNASKKVLELQAPTFITDFFAMEAHICLNLTPELQAVTIFAIMTMIISVLNVFLNDHVYYIHISVLSLKVAKKV